MRRLAAALGLLACLLAGCQTLTGRPAGQWADDRGITARVKARLAATGIENVTRVHVDTFEGVVYLTGGVESDAVKARAEELARAVPAVRLVVNNLHVGGDDGPVAAASPRTDVAAVPQGAQLDRPRGLPPRLARLEVESGTPAWTRYAGFDADGRRVATVFAVAGVDVRERGVMDVPARVPVTLLDIYPEPGGARYFVVLWHDADTDPVGPR